MYILAIETTGPYCSVTVIDENGKTISRSSKDRLNHLKLLTPMIHEVLLDGNIKISDIEAFAASEGPGSFTGIRIGVSTARALGQVLDAPCIAVPSLYAFAQGQKEDIAEDCIICPILDARREQTYACGCIEEKEVVAAGAYSIVEFLNELTPLAKAGAFRKAIFVGDGIDIFRDNILSWNETCNIEVSFKEAHQDSQAVAEEALKLFKRGGHLQYNDFTPEYMRKAEAERKLEERLRENG